MLKKNLVLIEEVIKWFLKDFNILKHFKYL